ncbi:MAG: ABC-type multidrug transport system, ATPase and permease component [Phycisphaerales bacterium]|nr:ABC-type multidrug transport system, ATPase and permease component [Phycisphaerales bacterium]
MNYLPRILSYMKPNGGAAAASAALVVTTAALALLIPWPLKVLIDSVLGDRPPPAVLAWAGASRSGSLLVGVVGTGLLLVLAERVLSALHAYVNVELEHRLALDLRGDLCRHAAEWSAASHDAGHLKAGHLKTLTPMIGTSAGEAAGVVTAMVPLIRAAVIGVGAIPITLYVDRTLSLLPLVAVPLLYALGLRRAYRGSARLAEGPGPEWSALSVFGERIPAPDPVAAADWPDREWRRFRRHDERACESRVRLAKRRIASSASVSALMAVVTALVVGLGAYRCTRGVMTFGELAVFAAYLGMIFRPLERALLAPRSIPEATRALRTAFDLLDLRPDLRDEPGAEPLIGCAGRVEFGEVDFDYPGRVGTLRDVSFVAEAGQVVAVVGPPGAGKHALARLIARHHDARSGEVRIDGRPVRGVALASLRRQVAALPEEPELFAGTIAENIRCGRPDAGDDEVLEAAKAANAHDFIAGLPRGYHTPLGERGAGLSGVERRRVAVARAFLQNAPILIVDEAGGAPDPRVDADDRRALDRLMAGRTTFVIARRACTARQADLILVMDGGRLVQRGSHDELMSEPGPYRQMQEPQGEPRREPVTPNGRNGNVWRDGLAPGQDLAPAASVADGSPTWKWTAEREWGHARAGGHGRSGGVRPRLTDEPVGSVAELSD